MEKPGLRHYQYNFPRSNFPKPIWPRPRWAQNIYLRQNNNSEFPNLRSYQDHPCPFKKISKELNYIVEHNSGKVPLS